MIGVTGATGTIGSELVRLLGEEGHEVRAYTRDPGRRGGLPGRELPGVEWVEADLADRAGLPSAFESLDHLFLLTGNSDQMVRLQKNAITASREGGVEHVVKLSALGATDHSRSVIGLWHYNVERELRGSGLAWTILRPHHFMQNLLDPEVFDREAGVVCSASGEGKIPSIDTRDIAAVAARVLTGEGHHGEIYTLTGPEALSYRRATEILADVLGRELTYRSQDDDEAWAHMRAAGFPTWLAAARLEIARYQRAGGPTARTTGTVERLTGRPPRSFREFAEEHREDLGGMGSS